MQPVSARALNSMAPNSGNHNDFCTRGRWMLGRSAFLTVLLSTIHRMATAAPISTMTNRIPQTDICPKFISYHKFYKLNELQSTTLSAALMTALSVELTMTMRPLMACLRR